MQSPSPFPARSASSTPVDLISRHFRWQLFLILVGIALLATLLGYSAYQTTMVLVPDQGGVFREGIVHSPKYLNPLLCTETDADKDWCALLYRGLTRLDKNGRVQPDIAEGWTIENNVAYTFRIKANQLWDDGTPITADDVIFTLGLLQNPEAALPASVTLFWQTVKVEKLDDSSVRFTLTEPLAPFLDNTTIGLLPAHIYQGLSPAELSGPLNTIPVGSGPFKVSEMTADHFRLIPNPNFPYVNQQRPHLSALELWFYPDFASLFQAYLEDKLDGVSRILPQNLQTVASRKDLQLFSSDQSTYLNVTLNLNNPNTPFFQEPAVRQALLGGLDRQKLIDSTVMGQGIVAHSIFLPQNWAYKTDVKKYPYEPDKARQLLDQAGWVDTNGDQIRDKNGKALQFQLITVNDPLRLAIANFIKSNWEALGARVEVAAISTTELINDFLVPRRFDAVLMSWEIEGDPDPYSLWHSSQAEKSGTNYSGWKNKDADQLMETARSTLTEPERRTLYARFQEIFAEELPALPLYYPVYTYGVSTRVKNVQIDSLNYPSERFANFVDWYVVTRRVPINQVPVDAPPTPPGGSGQ